MGGIGSGKTSGSAKTLALKYLEWGFGGLVLCAKKDEAQNWIDYAKLTQREQDLIVFSPQSDHQFNFLSYELNRSGEGAGLVENIVEILKMVMNIGAAQSGGSDDPFWEGARDLLLYNALDICLLAKGQLYLNDIAEVIKSAPHKDKDVPEEEFRKSACFQMLKAVYTKIAKGELSLDVSNDYRNIEQYFLNDFRNLAEKTRSIVEQYFFGFANRLLRRPFNKMFCSGTTFTPEDAIEKGKIIILDIPVKEYQKVGQISQVLFKYIFQKALERRKVHDRTRPIFIFNDECQHFLHDHDAEFAATSRSSRACMVNISQNLPNLLVNFGSGDEAQNKVDAIIGNHSTHIFHANACMRTNKYASELIGQEVGWSQSMNNSYGQGSSFSEGQSEQLMYKIRPEEFASLANGGPQNNFNVQAVMHKTGIPFNATAQNHLHITFKQN